jgi:hypothetical protein
MSRILLTKIVTPDKPATNKGAIYMDIADNRIKAIDQNGVITMLSDDGLSGMNVLHNSGFRLQQRFVPTATQIPALSTTTRAGQVSDRWAALASTTTNCTWTQTDTAGTQETNLQARYYGTITSATSTKKVMINQVVLSSDMSHLRGKKVRLSIKINQKVGSGQIYNLGLLQLTSAGVVDVMPAFLTGAWSGTSGTDPAWGTNLGVISPDVTPTGENCTVGPNWAACTSVATTWTKYSAVWTVPTSAKNLVFVVFQNSAGAATDAVAFSEAMITQGTEIVDYIELPLAYEVKNCQRFFSKSFPYAITPAASVTVANGGYGSGAPLLIAGSAAALAVQIPIQFPVTMWKVPAITYFTPTAAGAVVFRHTGTTPLSQGATATVASTLTAIGCTVAATSEATVNGAVGNWCSIHWSAEADFIL